MHRSLGDPMAIALGSMRVRSLLAAVALLLAAGCASAPFEVQVQQVTYANNGGVPQQADIYLPRGTGPFPAVVMIHGGGWRKGAPWQMRHIAEELSEQGFVVANIGYRLAPQFAYPAPVADSEAAVRWLRDHAAEYRIDVERVGAWGYSAGAHLALLLATRDTPVSPGSTSTRLAAVVGGGSPTDMTLFGENEIVTMFMGGTPSAMPDAYRDASPVTHVTPGDPPAFLYHGKSDWVVAPQHTHDFAERLRKAGIDVTVKEPFFGHIAVFLFGRAEEAAGIEFLRQRLRPPAP
jgi:acetyl esterase/lipase